MSPLVFINNLIGSVTRLALVVFNAVITTVGTSVKLCIDLSAVSMKSVDTSSHIVPGYNSAGCIPLVGLICIYSPTPGNEYSDTLLFTYILDVKLNSAIFLLSKK